MTRQELFEQINNLLDECVPQPQEERHVTRDHVRMAAELRAFFLNVMRGAGLSDTGDLRDPLPTNLADKVVPISMKRLQQSALVASALIHSLSEACPWED